MAGGVGGCGARVESRAELRVALREAKQCGGVSLIDAVLDPADVSPTWRRITDGTEARMRQ